MRTPDTVAISIANYSSYRTLIGGLEDGDDERLLYEILPHVGDILRQAERLETIDKFRFQIDFLTRKEQPSLAPRQARTVSENPGKINSVK